MMSGAVFIRSSFRKRLCNRASGVGEFARAHALRVRRFWRENTTSQAIGVPDIWREEAGQMAVELAVLMPVVIAVALILFNVLRFAELVACFDRVAPDAVLVQGVSPSGSSDGLGGVEAVREQIEAAMPEGSCQIQVALEEIGPETSDAFISLAAGAVRYTCSMTFTPWPSSVSIAGAGYSLPLSFTHERALIVDRYRAGIVT